MKACVNREDLLPGLSIVAKAAYYKGPIPILQNVLIQPGGAGLKLSATDMEVAIVAQICADDVEGSATVPAKALMAFVKGLPKGSEIQISECDKPETLELSSAGRSVQLPTLPVEDFPILGQAKTLGSFEVGAPDLSKIFRQTKHAISHEEIRYYLNGVFLLPAKGPGGAVLRGVSTDGHRMSVSDTLWPVGVSEKVFPKNGDRRGIIIPKLAVKFVMDLLGKHAAGTVAVTLSELRATFRYRGVEIITKAIDGTYPEYERVIPRDNQNTLSVDAKYLREASKSVADAVEDSGSFKKIRLSLSHKTCAVSSSDGSGGHSEMVLNGTTRYGGDPVEIGFQAKYVNDVLGVIEGAACIAVRDSDSPVVITAEADTSWKGVLMPIRI